jgi:aminopeptidase
MVATERLERYGQIIATVGLRVEAGDRVLIKSSLEGAPLARAVVRAAYAAGAMNVDVLWFDPEVERARFTHGPTEAAPEICCEAAVRDRSAQWSTSRLRISGEDPWYRSDLDPAQVARHDRAFAEVTRADRDRAIDFGTISSVAPAAG